MRHGCISMTRKPNVNPANGLKEGNRNPKRQDLQNPMSRHCLLHFFDINGLVHHEFIPFGRTINQEVYLGIMRRLREAGRLKRPERWQNNDWILHVDNAWPHTAHVVLQFLAKHSTIHIPHPPYSHNLAPNDFFLYPILKMKLKGRKFDNVDMIQAESKATLRNLSKSVFISCFDIWKKIWNRMISDYGKAQFGLTPLFPVPGPDEKEGGEAVKSLVKNLGSAGPADSTLERLQARNSTQPEGELEILQESPVEIRISIKDLSSETGLSVGLCHRIVTKDLDMIRASSKFVPRILTEEQKVVRMDVCKNMVEMTRTDPQWMQKIITGDETWVYQYDSETKRQSSQWIERGEPKPKKARFTKSNVKTLLVTFF
ncbi:hypothetical protein LAZ67_16000480 [Cordylochernes scorpioides]|uniref:Mariner transposase n=1 Tax=Cordylochernes scorpioides TaxID=51811 RepID=A0ABY6LAN1_9ARAC|nr:hypothetical protein LAZ67_16000480 [Cordylochernes scorpioides]